MTCLPEHTHTLSLSHTHTHSLSLSRSLSFPNPLLRAHAPTYTHTHFLSPSLSYTHLLSARVAPSSSGFLKVGDEVRTREDLDDFWDKGDVAKVVSVKDEEEDSPIVIHLAKNEHKIISTQAWRVTRATSEARLLVFSPCVCCHAPHNAVPCPNGLSDGVVPPPPPPYAHTIANYSAWWCNLIHVLLLCEVRFCMHTASGPATRARYQTLIWTSCRGRSSAS